MNAHRPLSCTGAQGQTSGPAELLLSLQFVQHSDLLCSAVRPGPAWAGNDGRFPALRSAVACQSFPA